MLRQNFGRFCGSEIGERKIVPMQGALNRSRLKSGWIGEQYANTGVWPCGGYQTLFSQLRILRIRLFNSCIYYSQNLFLLFIDPLSNLVHYTELFAQSSGNKKLIFQIALLLIINPAFKIHNSRIISIRDIFKISTTLF